MFLLDTDVVSNLRKPRPHPALVSWLSEVGDSEVAISVQTVFELQRGVEIVRKNDEAKADEIAAWLDGFVLKSFENILPLGPREAMLAASMWETPSLRNFVFDNPNAKRAKSGGDLMIAAVAIVREATLVTFNCADFLRIHEEFPLPGLVDAAGMVPAIEDERRP